MEHLNIILTDDVISFKIMLPFTVSLPYLFDDETKHLVCNLTHNEFTKLFLSSPDEETKLKFNERYKSIFLSSNDLSTKKFQQVIEDVKRIAFPQNSVIDLLISSALFINIDKSTRKSWVVLLSELAFNKAVFINLFVFGDDVFQQPLTHILGDSASIKSLSIVKSINDSELSQNVKFAHTETGIITDQMHKHMQLHNNYQTTVLLPRKISEIQQTQTTLKEKIYTTQDLFKAGEFAPGLFQILDDFDALQDAIPRNTAFTVVLPFNKMTNVQHLAEFAYRLKVNFSPESKLIIRELTHSIRYSDEQFLLRSGVNLVIPKALPFSRLLGQINAIQHHLFCLPLPSSIKSLKELRAEFDFQGHYGIDDFKHFILSAINEQNKHYVGYALIRLEAIADIPMVEYIKVCQIKRHGDMYATLNSAIYVFLSAVRSNEILAALNNIFEVDVLSLFSKYEVFDTASLIQTEFTMIDNKEEFIPSNEIKQGNEPVLAIDESFLFSKKGNFIRTNKRPVNEYT